MKKFTIILPALLLITCMSSCAQSYVSNGSGRKVKASKNYVTKEIKVKDFEGIQVTGGIDVAYTQQSGKPKVEIYTSDNIVDLLDVEVKDGQLHLGFKNNVSIEYNKLQVRVSSKDLHRLGIAGSGDFEFTNGLKTDQLKMSVAGSGDIKGDRILCSESLSISVAGSGDVNCNDLNAEEMYLSVAGSGDMKLTNAQATYTKASVAGSGTMSINGQSENAKYSVAGSGDLFADDFEAQNVEASVSGSGDIKCYAVKYLKAHTSGSGEIGYKGDPKVDYPYKKLYKL